MKKIRIISVLLVCVLMLNVGFVSAEADNSSNRGIIRGQRYCGQDRTDLKNCDIVDYLEIDMVPFGMSVQTPSNATNRYPSYRNHNALIPNGKIQYKFHKNDSVFRIFKNKINPEDPTKAAIRIKKAGKIRVTVVKPASNGDEPVTEDIVITVVDKRKKTKLSGIKKQYVKKMGDKSFSLNAVQSAYSEYYEKYMTYSDWVKAIKKKYGAYNKRYRGYNELYRYPYYKSDNPAVATVDSKGNVKIKKPGKATITVTVHLRKQSGWVEVDGNPGRVFNKPAVKKTIIIVKPRKQK